MSDVERKSIGGKLPSEKLDLQSRITIDVNSGPLADRICSEIPLIQTKTNIMTGFRGLGEINPYLDIVLLYLVKQ